MAVCFSVSVYECVGSVEWRAIFPSLELSKFFEIIVYGDGKREMLNSGNKNDIQNGTTINASKTTTEATKAATATAATTTIIAAL